MSWWNVNAGGSTPATITTATSVPSALMRLLQFDNIEPGSAPGYQTCKDLYAYHPLGSKMADSPINMAQSQERTINIDDPLNEQLIKAFRQEWGALGKVGADVIIHNTMKQSRIYGIASLIVGVRGQDPSEPIDWPSLYQADLYFNVADPLNTAGSLVLSQDPNSPDYQKPQGIRIGAQDYNPGRIVVMLNEQPIYIQWSDSAFGFVGRSVYQRAFFPLKSFIQTMITDDWIVWKAGLLVAKMESPGSTLDNRARKFFAYKRSQIQQAATGNVLSIGKDENIESVDLKNLRDATEFARSNILKNIATAANMPANMLNNETLTEGFGEGTEDAKQIVRYIDRVRIEMKPLYDMLDKVVQHRAWSPDFFKAMKKEHPALLEGDTYESAFYRWRHRFTTTWPNLLIEPDSKLVERDASVINACRAMFEVLAPRMDQKNTANMAVWLSEVANARKMLVSTPLVIDRQAMEDYTPPSNVSGAEPNF